MEVEELRIEGMQEEEGEVAEVTGHYENVEEMGARSVTIQVSLDQESAMEAFFQINSWHLIKEKRESATADHGPVLLLTLRLSSEQEAAMEAFFQINNWTLVRVETEMSSLSKILHDIHSTQGDMVAPDHVLLNDGTTVEEVQGLREVQVTAQGADGKPQIITVYTEGGDAHGIPRSLLTDGVSDDGKDNPQVIIQEISLPDGISLDQGLIYGPSKPTIRKITHRGTTKPGDKVYKCHVCNKTFKQAQSFHGHYQSHFGAKPFQCDVCQTGFTLKAALVAHMSIHSGAKPFSCALCNKGFRRKDDMISHIRTHTGEKPYECDICGKKFKYRNQIPKHRRGHTGDRPYKCSVCTKTFTSNIHLRRHERTHTGERPYVCTVCSKAFTQCGHLQAHMRIHTDERPFACSICGRGFREKKVMKKHETLHTSERPYKCKVCDKGFLRQSNLELHSVMHQKERDGALLVRPRPKKKKADAEMRDFVANVLLNVKRVDSSMQTESYVNGIPSTEDNTTETSDSSAFVNYTVTHSTPSGIKVEPVTTLQSMNSEEQYTLVMQEDGSEGYLIAGYEQGEVTQEIVTMPSQQVEVSSGFDNPDTVDETGDMPMEAVTYSGSEDQIAIKALEKAVSSSEDATDNTGTEDGMPVEQSVDSKVISDVSVHNEEFGVEKAAELETVAKSDVVKT